jgi:hypothetical protein
MTSTSNIPSTRETIDLVSDEESDVLVKKRDPSVSPATDQLSHTMPSTVTMRKRFVKDDFQDDTPSRPPVKKHKSPTGEAIPVKPIAGSTSSKQPNGNTGQSLSRSISPLPVAGNQSFTQIPDSEGEEEDDFFGGDEFNFNSDDIPYDAKKLLHSAPHIPNRDDDPKTEKQEEENIVPESPLKVENDYILPFDHKVRRDQSPIPNALQPSGHLSLGTVIENNSQSRRMPTSTETPATFSSSSVFYLPIRF